jgi:hypothetical protein
MGGNSSTLSSTQVNNFMQKQTTSFASSTSQNVQASGTVAQLISLGNSEFTDCRFAVTNKATVGVTSQGSLSTNSTANLSSALQAAANNAIQQASTQSNGWLATGSNDSSQTTNIQNNVSHIIDTTIKSSTVQDILAQASGTQTIGGAGMKVRCNPKYSKPGKCDANDSSGCDFSFNNDIVMTVTAKGIADAITSAIENDSTVAQFVNSSSQTNDQSNGGIPIPEIGAIIAACVVLCILVACCLVGGGILMTMKH